MLNLNQRLKFSGNELVPPPPEKFKLSGKIMLISFRDLCGMMLAHFMPNSQTITARYYSEVILKKTQGKTENVASQASQKKCFSFA